MRMPMRRTIGLSLAFLVVATAALAKPAHPSHEPPASGHKAKPVKVAADAGKSARHRKPAAQHETHKAASSHKDEAKLPPLDRYIGPVQVTGVREVGSAAWYGGRHLGQRTASGDRLDAIRPTAAHRSLPLHSLVRVTNLGNGRSVIVTITDRGPVSPNRLIDVSPRVADELEMKRTGIAKVAVEPVALVQAR